MLRTRIEKVGSPIALPKPQALNERMDTCPTDVICQINGPADVGTTTIHTGPSTTERCLNGQGEYTFDRCGSALPVTGQPVHEVGFDAAGFVLVGVFLLASTRVRLRRRARMNPTQTS